MLSREYLGLPSAVDYSMPTVLLFASRHLPASASASARFSEADNDDKERRKGRGRHERRQNAMPVRIRPLDCALVRSPHPSGAGAAAPLIISSLLFASAARALGGRLLPLIFAASLFVGRARRI